MLWSFASPNPVTKRTTLNKQKVQYIYVRIYRRKPLPTLHHESDIQMTCHETPACRIICCELNLTIRSFKKPLNAGEKRTYKRKFLADMFSESPYIRALAFSKHHILSVNNLVFVRSRSGPRGQNYSVPEKFKILSRRTISQTKIFSSAIIR